ncbi:MAG: DUF1385 domain-containing protein [Defluviitaleaceae bacterium]|nr:DUF1385 domain-containing protein [Defluviitaleaceae bacterium]
MKNKNEPVYYGGQAVMEGILMRGTKAYAMAVRRPNGEIVIIEKPLSTLTQRYPFLKWPLIRGVVALCSSMALGFSALSQSADIAMEDEAPPESRFEKFLMDKLGDRFNDILKILAMVLAVIIAVGLFMLLPAFIGSRINAPGAFTGVIEGLVRIAIFVGYVFVVSRSKDIQRVFQYHGAEHKAINCHEANMPLTTENVAACNRLHKRCGTSFMLVVMVITMLLFMIIQIDGIWLRFASRILLLPVIAGLSYEVSVKWAGRRDNALVRAIIAPGMLMQRLTTVEPEVDQIEVAITALNKCLEQENPPKLPEIVLINELDENEPVELVESIDEPADILDASAPKPNVFALPTIEFEPLEKIKTGAQEE